MNHLRIAMVVNGPHITDTDRIGELLTQHLELNDLNYLPDETYCTGSESPTTEVHLMAFKNADTLVFIRVGVDARTQRVEYIETSKVT